MGFFLNDDLRVTRDACREFRRQGDRFVERIGVQGLRAAKYRRHRFDGGTDHVVVRILFGQRPARSLAVRTQHHGLGVLGAETAHDAVPQQTRGAHLGNFQIEIHADGPEEGQTTCENVDVHPRVDAGLYVFFTISQRKGQFKRLVSTCFGDMVAGDRDRVELRHVLRGIGEDIRDDLH